MPGAQEHCWSNLVVCLNNTDPDIAHSRSSMNICVMNVRRVGKMTCQMGTELHLPTPDLCISCAMPLLVDIAKSLAGEHQAGGVHRIGRTGYECMTLPPPLALERTWEPGAPFHKTPAVC